MVDKYLVCGTLYTMAMWWREDETRHNSGGKEEKETMMVGCRRGVDASLVGGGGPVMGRTMETMTQEMTMMRMRGIITRGRSYGKTSTAKQTAGGYIRGVQWWGKGNQESGSGQIIDDPSAGRI